MLQQPFVLLGELLRVRTDVLEELNSRLEVLLGSGKRLRLLNSYAEEYNIQVATIDPRDVEASTNVQQLVTGRQGFINLVLTV